jgi:hypothetical protein
MKINKFTTLLSIALTGLIAFYLSSIVSTNKFSLIFGFGAFISLCSSLIGAISISFDYDRTTTLTKTTSAIFFSVILSSQIIFTFIDEFEIPSYIFATGGLTILYILVVYGISKSKH